MARQIARLPLKRPFPNAVAAGGGSVIVPPGDWLVRGPIHLKSGVNLHLESGATVRFSTDPTDYLPVVRTRFEGNELMNFSPLLYAYEQHDIAITGSGTFDGQASKDAWWNWKSSSGHDRQSLQKMSDDGVHRSNNGCSAAIINFARTSSSSTTAIMC